MKICPLCKRTYPDIAKVCPQLHCPNCGSTNIKEKEDDLALYFLSFILIVLFGAVVSFFSIGATIMGVLLSIALIVYALNLSSYYCNTCRASFYRPMKNILLKEITRETIDARGSRGDTCPVCGAPAEPGAKYCWRRGSRLG